MFDFFKSHLSFARLILGLLSGLATLIQLYSAPVQGADATASLQMRVWTDINNRKAEGMLVSVEHSTVRVRKPNGKLAQTTLAQLSESDREYINRHRRAASPAAEGGRDQAQSSPSSSPKRLERLRVRIGSAIERAQKANEAAEPSDNQADGLELPENPVFPLLAPPPKIIPAHLIHARVSRRFLEQFIDRTIAQDSQVNDQILGTAIRGRARTVGSINLRLFHDESRARGEVVFAGNISSTTNGYNGPVILHNIARTRFQSRKELAVGPGGLNVGKAKSSARTRSQTCSIDACLPGLRGMLAERIALRRVDQLRDEADAIASRHAEARLNRNLDSRVDLAVSNVQRILVQQIPRLPYYPDYLPPQIRFSSTPEHVYLVMHRTEATAEETAIAPPPLSDDDISVRVHRLVIRRAITEPEIRQAGIGLVRNLLANRASTGGRLRDQHLTGDTLDVPKSGGINMDQADLELEFGWSDDRNWLVLNFRARPSH